MKKLLFLLFYLPLFYLVSIPLFGQEEQPDKCGNIEDNLQNPTVPRPPELVQSPLISHLAQELLEFHVFIHVVQPKEGNHHITVGELNQAMSIVNHNFGPANLRFATKSIQYIGEEFDEKYGYKTTDEHNRLIDSFQVKDVINVYVVPQADAAGWATFPATTQNTKAKDWVFITYDDVLNCSTLSHELGHYFGLLHTHEKNHRLGEEYVSRDSCAYKGDCLCGTPADPSLRQKVDAKTCQFTDTMRRDGNGDRYQPNTHDIMSYSLSHCRKSFHAQQLSLVRQVAQQEDGRAYVKHDVLHCDAYQVLRQYTNGNNIQALAMTDQLIYAASRGGLVRWDISTSTATKWTTLDGLPANYIADIAILSDGRLLLAMEKGLYQCMVTGNHIAVKRIKASENIAVTKILVQTVAEVWIGTTEGIGLVDLTLEEPTISYYAISDTKEQNIPNTNIITDLASTAEFVWATTYSGLTRINRQKPTLDDYHLVDIPPLNDQLLTTITIAADQTIWLGTWFGLIQVTAKSNDVFQLDTVAKELVGIYDIKIDPTDNSLWLAGKDIGLVNWTISSSNSLFYNLVNTIEFTSNHIKEIIWTPEGIWGGSIAGLFHLSTATKMIEPYLMEEEWQIDNFIQKIVTTDEGIWVATLEKGVLFYDHDGQLQKVYDEGNGLPSRLTRSMVADKDGVIWVSTQSGLAQINEEQVKVIHDSFFIKELIATEDYIYGVTNVGLLTMRQQDGGIEKMDSLAHIKMTIVDTTGSIWAIKHQGNEVYRLSYPATENNWEAFITDFSGTEQLNAIGLSEDHRLWVVTSAQIKGYAFDEHTVLYTEKLINYEKVKDDLLEKTVQVITPIGDDLYIGTDDGLFVLKHGFLSTYEVTGLPATCIYDITPMANGEIWIGTTNGIGVLGASGMVTAGFLAATMELNIADTVTFRNNSINALEWSWLVNEVPQTLYDNQTTMATYLEEGYHVITLVATNGTCVDSFQQEVKVLGESSGTMIKGDANNDGRIDQYDFLAIGLGFGEVQANRVDENRVVNDCDSIIALDWDKTLNELHDHELNKTLFNNVNLKHLDINGDGRIDEKDIELFVTLFRNSNCRSELVIDPTLSNGDIELTNESEHVQLTSTTCDEEASAGLVDSIFYKLETDSFYAGIFTFDYPSYICDISIQIDSLDNRSFFIFEDVARQKLYIGISQTNREMIKLGHQNLICVDITLDDIAIDIGDNNSLLSIDEASSFIIDNRGSITPIENKPINTQNSCLINTVNAIDDVAITSKNTPILINVLANDQDVNTESEIRGFSQSFPIQSENGVVTNVRNYLKYTPNINFSGKDTFYYQIINDLGCVDNAMVVVEVENDCSEVTTTCIPPVGNLAITPVLCDLFDHGYIDFYIDTVYATSANIIWYSRYFDVISFQALPLFNSTDTISIIACAEAAVSICDTAYIVVAVSEDCLAGKTAIHASPWQQNYIQKIYPNPTIEQLSVQLQSKTEIAGRATIYSMTGQQMYQEEKIKLSAIPSNLIIDVVDYPTGTYFFYFQTPEGIAVEKFVKQ